MKGLIDGKEYVEKEELFSEVNRLLAQDKKFVIHNRKRTL